MIPENPQTSLDLNLALFTLPRRTWEKNYARGFRGRIMQTAVDSSGGFIDRVLTGAAAAGRGGDEDPV